MNSGEEEKKSFLLELLELLEYSEDEEGIRKSEIRADYGKRYKSISSSRVGGGVDILVDLGLLLENKKTGLFKISSIGEGFLSRIRHGEKNTCDICKEILSNGLQKV